MRKEDTVTTYIDQYTPEIKSRLNQIRAVIQEAASSATESISYGMPAYKTYKKPLVYFAGYDQHIGFYATPSGHSEFADELSNYKQGKGSVQFPHDEELPIELISRIVSFRVKENQQKYGK